MQIRASSNHRKKMKAEPSRLFLRKLKANLVLVMTSFRNFPVFLGRDIVAAFKCFEISVFDIALPPATLKFLDCTTWRKGGENDNGKPAYYPQLVGEMNALSKVCLKQLDIFDEFDITIQLKSFPVYLT